MPEFTDVAKARESFALFAAAMSQGREILLRAGIAEAAPPVPEFDTVYRRLNAAARETLFTELRKLECIDTPNALRIWQPLLKSTASPRRSY